VFTRQLSPVQARLSIAQASDSERVFAKFSAGFARGTAGACARYVALSNNVYQDGIVVFVAPVFLKPQSARDHVLAWRRSSHCETEGGRRYFMWELSGIQDHADRRMAWS
jgi:hypothetical protein